MKKETRTVCFDDDLLIEAVSFEGIVQPFPNHFHDYYVIGLVQRGEREMQCKNQTHNIHSGSILLLEPSDNHGCVQTDGGVFDYISLNVPEKTMNKLTEEITGKNTPLRFSKNVVENDELKKLIITLHSLIFDDCREFEKEETLLLLTENIIKNYGQDYLEIVSPYSNDVHRVCSFIEEHYAEHISLAELCVVGNMSKSALLRSFTKYKGITPYRYLQSVRINRAKELLEQGTSPIDTAFLTGFSDQSHFTNAFHTFIGLSPAAYGKIFDKKER